MSDHDYNLDPLDKAIHDTVLGYANPQTGVRGGKALAQAIGMPVSTLLNKANPNEAYANLTVKEARQVMLVSGDNRILHQLAQDVGEACVPLPSLDAVGDLDVINALTEWQAEVGETAQNVRDIYKDGVVHQSEVADLRRELIEDFEKGLALLDRVAAQADPDEKVVPLTGVKR